MAAGLSRRHFLLGGGMAATALIAEMREPSASIDLLGKRELEDIIPEQVGAWRFHSTSGLVVPPEDQLSEQLYAKLLTRTYTAPDLPPIMLLVAQGAKQTGVIQIHRPEVCYPVGGFQLSERRNLEVSAPGKPLTVASFTATAASRVEHLIYWTRIGHALPSTWLEQRWAVAQANLSGYIPDAVLVRLSTLSLDQISAIATLQDFGRNLLSSVDNDARTFLIGRR